MYIVERCLFETIKEENMAKDLDDWLTTEEAATYLRISPAALRNMTSNGQIPYYKLGRRNRYSKQELKELVSAQKRGPIGVNLKRGF